MASVKMEVGPLSIAANSKNSNIFDGKQFRTAPFDCKATLLMTGSAQGLEGGLLGGPMGLVMEEENLNTNNRAPLVPDDVVVSDIELFEGQPIAVPVRNTTAGALNVFARMIFEEAFLDDEEFFE